MGADGFSLAHIPEVLEAMLNAKGEAHEACATAAAALDASAEETVLTRAYTGAPLRVIKNPCVRHSKLMLEHSGACSARKRKVPAPLHSLL